MKKDSYLFWDCQQRLCKVLFRRSHAGSVPKMMSGCWLIVNNAKILCGKLSDYNYVY